jgi:hypothetical protein
VSGVHICQALQACAEAHLDSSSRARAPAADGTHPAADTAGQVSAGLAVLAQFFQSSDSALALRMQTKAKRAYEYSVAMFTQYGMNASCSNSGAMTNCVGASCAPARGVRATCAGMHVQADAFADRDLAALLLAHAAAAHTKHGELVTLCCLLDCASLLHSPWQRSQRAAAPRS